MTVGDLGELRLICIKAVAFRRLKFLGISDFSSAIILAIISFLSGLGWMLC